MNVVTKGSNYVTEIEKRQALLKQALLIKSRYPIMNEDDKSLFDTFSDMQSVFKQQVKEAELALKLGMHLLKIYECYIDKIKTLYNIVNDFFTVYGDNTGDLGEHYYDSNIVNECNYQSWCDRLTPILLDIQEFSSHQYFLNQYLFVDPKNCYIIDTNRAKMVITPGSLQTNDSAKDTFYTIFNSGINGKNTQQIYSKEITLVQILGDNLPNEAFTLLTSKKTTSIDIALLKAKTANIRTIDIKIPNRDNSIATTLNPTNPGGASAKDMAWFDPSYISEVVATAYSNETYFQSELTSDLSIFLSNIFTHLEAVAANQTELQRQVYVVKAVLECAKTNLEFTATEIDDLASVNDEQLVSMIESGNALKVQIAKLPTIKSTSIFSFEERKRCCNDFDIYF